MIANTNISITCATINACIIVTKAAVCSRAESMIISAQQRLISTTISVFFPKNLYNSLIPIFCYCNVDLFIFI
jgi:hypothetical protein